MTIGDLYREITGMRSDIVRSLTRIEVIEASRAREEQVSKDHEDRIRALRADVPQNLDKRLGLLEQFKWKLGGMAIAGALVFSALGTVIGVVLTRK